MGDAIFTVFFGHVRDHFIPPLDAEIGVDVRHRNALGIQKAFEEEVEAKGIQVRYFQAVRDQRADRRPATRPHRDTPISRILDEVPHDQEIRRESHLNDDAELVFQALAQRRIRRYALAIVALKQTFFAELAQIIRIALFGFTGTLRNGKLRQMEDLFGDAYVHSLRDLDRILTGFRKIAPKLAHLAGRLQVELIGIELHSVRIRDRLACSDAEQDVVCRGILLLEVMRIVGCDDRHVQLASNSDETVVDRVLLRHAVTHHFDVKTVADNLFIGLGVLPRGRFVPAQQRRGDQAGHAAGEHDQTVVMLFEKLEIDARLVIVAFQEALGYQGDEISVAD